ncbi:MAG: hypothetical protein ABI831_02240 [Betaproteobacteria bacterium]
MIRNLALKRLTRSDLTLFESQFRSQKAGNQKAINLNAAVFVDEMYPLLPSEALSRNGRFPLDLDIYGPGGSPGLNVQRKIVKFGEYKNWRLNGEFIGNPIDEPARFDGLREGDFALFEFKGLSFPESAQMVLVSEVGDQPFHSACAAFLGNRAMATVTVKELDTFISAAGLDETFPIAGSNLEAVLEDAAKGGLAGVHRLQKRAVTRPVTSEELQAALLRANEIGLRGEVFVNDYLGGQRTINAIVSFEWNSLTNAVAPNDFTIELDNGIRQRIDVKATEGSFKNRLHISISELLCMLDDSVPYQLYRIYDIDRDRAKLRVSGEMRTFARQTVTLLESLPPGVTADGLAVSPDIIQFGAEIDLVLRPDEE